MRKNKMRRCIRCELFTSKLIHSSFNDSISLSKNVFGGRSLILIPLLSVKASERARGWRRKRGGNE